MAPMKSDHNPNVHDSDSHTRLYEADQKLSTEIDAIKSTLAKQDRAAAKQFRVSMGQLISLLIALIGGGTWMSDFRSTFKEQVGEVRAEMREGLADVNVRLESVNAQVIKLNTTTAIMQNDAQQVGQLQKRIDALQESDAAAALARERLESRIQVMQQRLDQQRM